MTHGINTIVVSPSGWRAYCVCGWRSEKAYGRSEANSLFLEHAEHNHGIVVEEDGDDAA